MQLQFFYDPLAISGDGFFFYKFSFISSRRNSGIHWNLRTNDYCHCKRWNNHRVFLMKKLMFLLLISSSCFGQQLSETESLRLKINMLQQELYQAKAEIASLRIQSGLNQIKESHKWPAGTTVQLDKNDLPIAIFPKEEKK